MMHLAVLCPFWMLLGGQQLPSTLLLDKSVGVGPHKRGHKSCDSCLSGKSTGGGCSYVLVSCNKCLRKLMGSFCTYSPSHVRNGMHDCIPQSYDVLLARTRIRCVYEQVVNQTCSLQNARNRDWNELGLAGSVKWAQEDKLLPRIPPIQKWRLNMMKNADGGYNLPAQKKLKVALYCMCLTDSVAVLSGLQLLYQEAYPACEAKEMADTMIVQQDEWLKWWAEQEWEATEGCLLRHLACTFKTGMQREGGRGAVQEEGGEEGEGAIPAIQLGMLEGWGGEGVACRQ